MAISRIEDDPQWQQIEEEILCPICRTIFTDPKIIPSCLHTFCKKCLEESIRSNAIAEIAACCPVCRAAIPATKYMGLMRPNYLTDLRVERLIGRLFYNKSVGNTMEKVREVEPVRGCTKCDEEFLVVSWCVECQASLCRGCDMVHGKWKEFRQHTIVTIEEYLSQPKHYTMEQQTSDNGTATEEEQNKDGEVENKESTDNLKQLCVSSNINQSLSYGDTGNVSSSSNKDNEDESSQSAAIYPLHVTKRDVLPFEIDMLKFKEGDLFYVMKIEGNQCYVKAKHSGEMGYVPRSCLEKCVSLLLYGWYFGAITKEDAEIILMQPVSTCGSFLVRDYKMYPDYYTLSVRDTNKIRHYLIRKSQYGEFYVNAVQLTFKTVPDLILHYSQLAGELCTTLKASHFILTQQRYVDRWEIVNRNTVQLGQKIETDEMLDVWDGKWMHAQVTIKTPRKECATFADFFKNVELLKQLSHGNIVNLLGVSTQENPIYIITEYVDYQNSCATEHMKYGNLLTYLRRKGKILTYFHLIDMGIQVASAMEYLEEKKCVLRNLQAKNIVVCFCLSQSYFCKIASFSLAKIISEYDYVESTAQEQFPIEWTAVESLRSKRFTVKSDVWSFGIVLYELITRGDEPYPYPIPAFHEWQGLFKKLDTGYRMPCPASPIKLYNIMKECWRAHAVERPTFGELQQKLRNLL